MNEKVQMWCKEWKNSTMLQQSCEYSTVTDKYYLKRQCYLQCLSPYQKFGRMKIEMPQQLIKKQNLLSIVLRLHINEDSQEFIKADFSITSCVDFWDKFLDLSIWNVISETSFIDEFPQVIGGDETGIVGVEFVEQFTQSSLTTKANRSHKKQEKQMCWDAQKEDGWVTFLCKWLFWWVSRTMRNNNDVNGICYKICKLWNMKNKE